MKKTLALFLITAATYLLLWPIPIDPQPWQADPNPGYQGPFAANEVLEDLQYVSVAPYHGPEDLAFAADGTAYVPAHEGAILRVRADLSGVDSLVETGGRPLGIEFGSDGMLYIADAFKGLMRVDVNSSDPDVELLSDQTENGSVIGYADDLDIAADGRVFFSDASTRFPAQANGGTFPASILDITEHQRSGRILMYDPKDANAASDSERGPHYRRSKILVDGLSFANGVALSADDSYLLIIETGEYQVKRYWLEGEKSGQLEVILSGLPGFPDNINRAPDGSFWMGVMSPRSTFLDQTDDKPLLRAMVQRLPTALRPSAQRHGMVLNIDGDGRVLRALHGPSGAYAHTTGAIPGPDGQLFITSLTEPRFGRLAAEQWNPQ